MASWHGDVKGDDGDERWRRTMTRKSDVGDDEDCGDDGEEEEVVDGSVAGELGIVG